jgi:CheY-like chemotaxis protein
MVIREADTRSSRWAVRLSGPRLEEDPRRRRMFTILAGETKGAEETTRVDVRNLPEPAKKSTPGRVLVVDDEPLLRWSVGETLQDAGFQVIEATDGASAMAALRQAAHIDVVLLDLVLPDSDDLRLLSAMYRSAPDLAVILMTAYGIPELSRAAASLGAFAVIAKPFEIDELPGLVKRAIERRQPV